jgi:hypothetical protein
MCMCVCVCVCVCSDLYAFEPPIIATVSILKQICAAHVCWQFKCDCCSTYVYITDLNSPTSLNEEQKQHLLIQNEEYHFWENPSQKRFMQWSPWHIFPSFVSSGRQSATHSCPHEPACLRPTFLVISLMQSNGTAIIFRRVTNSYFKFLSVIYPRHDIFLQKNEEYNN